MSIVSSLSVNSFNSINCPDSPTKRTYSFVAGRRHSISASTQDEIDSGLLIPSHKKLSEMGSYGSLKSLNEDENMIIYEISSVIVVGEKEQADQERSFKCFMRDETREFFIEITDREKLLGLTQSTLLNILDIADEAHAGDVYVCISRNLKEKDSLLRSLSFIGFKQVTEEEQASLGIDKEFVVSKCKLNPEEEI